MVRLAAVFCSLFSGCTQTSWGTGLLPEKCDLVPDGLELDKNIGLDDGVETCAVPDDRVEVCKDLSCVSWLVGDHRKAGTLTHLVSGHDSLVEVDQVPATKVENASHGGPQFTFVL